MIEIERRLTAELPDPSDFWGPRVTSPWNMQEDAGLEIGVVILVLIAISHQCLKSALEKSPSEASREFRLILETFCSQSDFISLSQFPEKLTLFRGFHSDDASFSLASHEML